MNQRMSDVYGKTSTNNCIRRANLRADERKEFVIRRRDGLICYLIASTLLQVATEIERLIEHK